VYLTLDAAASARQAEVMGVVRTKIALSRK
jgi:hypothetical protein